MANQASDPKLFEEIRTNCSNAIGSLLQVHLDPPDSEARREKMVWLGPLASLVRRVRRENLVHLGCLATKGRRARLETR